MSCGNGKFTLDPFPPLRHLVQERIGGESQSSKHFLSRFREYNYQSAMTSLDHKDAAVQGRNISVRIQSEIYLQLWKIKCTKGEHARHFKAPTGDEVTI